MSATRTQVYFTAQQRDALDRRAHDEGVTLAQIVRDAVDRYVADDLDEAGQDQVLSETFGTCRHLTERVPTRDEWHRG